MELAPTIIGTARDAATLLGWLAENADEVAGIAHLDEEHRVLAVTQHPGSLDEVELPVRAIIEEAVRLGSKGLVIAHNHPGGDATPSDADRAITRKLAGALEMLDIRLQDHLIFTRRGCLSFRAEGLL